VGYALFCLPPFQLWGFRASKGRFRNRLWTFVRGNGYSEIRARRGFPSHALDEGKICGGNGRSCTSGWDSALSTTAGGGFEALARHRHGVHGTGDVIEVKFGVSRA
jgi:hypothetical protein